ncbi:MAG TPA: FAD-binding oxidoreductase [Candidatus Limnocylindrales bacterium]|nr:FAD-binding oxidoreductase [Candidatus Limnocylindrales bacterium]
MNSALIEELKKIIRGDVATDDGTLTKYSHDASIFEIKPQVVVFPKNVLDVQNLVKFAATNKLNNHDLSLTARAASTCMSGGGLNTSIIIAFQKYFNHKPHITGNTATVEPGVFYRDLEKETLKHHLIFPSYPSSREICALGGIVNNNAGGEKSLGYGKTEDYVKELKMVLSDGNEYRIKPLNEHELKKKIAQDDFEGKLYKKIFNLIDENYDIIKNAKPDVSKNSAGYLLWNVYDKEKKIFDLTKLFVGAQGTLGLMTEAKLHLVPTKKHTEMMILYMNDFSRLAELVNDILPFKPESIEAYDDKTLKLALKFFPEFAKKLGTRGILSTALKFLPELELYKEHKLPKLVIQIEFASDELDDLTKKIEDLTEKLKSLHPTTKIAVDDEEKKYWLIRRDSFGLLRSHIKEMYSSPFIDDIVVKPEHLPKFLPEFYEIMDKYPSIKETFAGHIGNGNFHVIPLVKLTDPDEQILIPQICQEVFELVTKYKGSTSGEHNDGWIRTPYLHLQFDKKILELFEETKKIFDPHGIFNPHKKVDGDLEFAMNHIRKSW